MSRKIRNVLSLFDGMSCGRQALERANIKIDKYYASEIDKYAIKVTQHNYPDTIQIGSVTEVDVSQLEPIDLLIGGSPCQSFSFAGKRNGMTTTCNEEIYTLDRYLELKSEGFKFEGESYLFWEYMRILTDIRKYNPNVLFLLENVEMGNKWERILSEAIGIFGVHINSALVSAQNRKRIYWTNIRVRGEGLFGELHSDIPQPEDRGILLKDILEDEVDEKYYVSSKSMMNFITDEWRINKSYTQINGKKSLPQRARQYSNWNGDYVCVAMRGRGENNEQQLEPQSSGKTNSLTSVQKDNLLIVPEATRKGFIEIQPGECFDAENLNSKIRRGRKMKDKSNCLMAKEMDFMRYEGSLTADQFAKFNPDVDASKHNALTQAIGRGVSSSEYMDSVSKVSSLSSRIRRLTPVECERLQTVKDNFTACVSDSQRYKMLGNGWNVETVAHIFSFI